MQLSELWARSRNAVMDRVDTAADKAKERLVVVGGYSPSLSLKWLLVAVLLAFGGGVFTGIKWDVSRFAEFRAEAQALADKKEKENQKLSADLATLRAQLDLVNAQHDAADGSFLDIINAPGEANQCSVPVGPINAIIAEAGK